MRGRRALALAAAAAAAAVGAAEWNGGPAAGGTGVGASREVCALRRADRAKTPSHACMQCHDGSSGKGTSIAGSHPIAIDYAAAAARHPDKFTPRGGLPAEVKLVDGKIECTTCHDGASSEPNHVVGQPQFCTACHRL